MVMTTVGRIMVMIVAMTAAAGRNYYEQPGGNPNYGYDNRGGRDYYGQPEGNPNYGYDNRGGNPNYGYDGRKEESELWL